MASGGVDVGGVRRGGAWASGEESGEGNASFDLDRTPLDVFGSFGKNIGCARYIFRFSKQKRLEDSIFLSRNILYSINQNDQSNRWQ